MDRASIVSLLESLSLEKMNRLLEVINQPTPAEIARTEKEKEYKIDMEMLAGYAKEAKEVRLLERTYYDGMAPFAARVIAKYHSLFTKYPHQQFYVIVGVVEFGGYTHIIPEAYFNENQFHYDVNKLRFIDKKMGQAHRVYIDSAGRKSRAYYSYFFNNGVMINSEYGGYKNIYNNVEIFDSRSLDMLKILMMMMDNTGTQ